MSWPLLGGPVSRAGLGKITFFWVFLFGPGFFLFACFFVFTHFSSATL